MTKKTAITSSAAAALAVAGVLLFNQPSAIIVPVNPRVLQLDPSNFVFAGKGFTRYELERNDGTGWKPSPWTVACAKEFEMFRAVAGHGGEIDLPGGTTAEGASRVIARRADGLMAVCYQAAGAMRVAFVREVAGVVATYDLNAGYFGYGAESAWAGNKLFVVGSDPAVGSVFDLDVSEDTFPTITENELALFHDPTYSLRWPSITVANGGVVASWYLQVTTGTKARVAYRNPAGTWTDGVVQLPSILETSQTAGTAVLATHPASGQVWLTGNKDSLNELPLVVFDADESLTIAEEKILVHGYPNNGVSNPCAFHGELPMNYRMWPEGDKMMFIGNAREFKVMPAPYYFSLTPLVYFSADAAGNTAFIRKTTDFLWTERVYPDYACVDGKIYGWPISTNATTWPPRDGGSLVAEDGSVLTAVDDYLPLLVCFEAKAIGYASGGQLKLNLL